MLLLLIYILHQLFLVLADVIDDDSQSHVVWVNEPVVEPEPEEVAPNHTVTWVIASLSAVFLLGSTGFLINSFLVLKNMCTESTAYITKMYPSLSGALKPYTSFDEEQYQMMTRMRDPSEGDQSHLSLEGTQGQLRLFSQGHPLDGNNYPPVDYSAVPTGERLNTNDKERVWQSAIDQSRKVDIGGNSSLVYLPLIEEEMVHYRIPRGVLASHEHSRTSMKPIVQYTYCYQKGVMSYSRATWEEAEGTLI